MLADINLDITRSCHEGDYEVIIEVRKLNTPRLVFMILHLHTRQHFKHSSAHDKWVFLNNKIKISTLTKNTNCVSLEADGANEFHYIIIYKYISPFYDNV